MYICICRAVTDRQVREAIDGGACTRKQLSECLGVGRVCGKCNNEVKAMLAVATGCGRAGACHDTVSPATAVWPDSKPIYSTQEGSRL